MYSEYIHSSTVSFSAVLPGWPGLSLLQPPQHRQAPARHRHLIPRVVSDFTSVAVELRNLPASYRPVFCEESKPLRGEERRAEPVLLQQWPHHGVMRGHGVLECEHHDLVRHRGGVAGGWTDSQCAAGSRIRRRCRAGESLRNPDIRAAPPSPQRWHCHPMCVGRQPRKTDATESARSGERA